VASLLFAKTKGMNNKTLFAVLAALVAAASAVCAWSLLTRNAGASYRFSSFEGRPPIHVRVSGAKNPSGITPVQIKKIYKLPTSGGTGTIAIVDAYDDLTVEKDLAVFSSQYNLLPCTTTNGCFEKHKMSTSTAANSGWALEEALDVEWAHAIAPTAKILLVEAKTPSGVNLLNAVDYAAARKDVVAVSMSWGGPEFSDEASLDSHFSGRSSSTAFFASSGDNGAGASWPASSAHVIGVGGTTLEVASTTGSFISESAWAGSGGGVSAYEIQPDFQKSYKIPKANKMRAIPDVSYDADPASGFPVYKTSGSSTSTKGWYTVGGTSAGAPQWAAIHALRKTVSLPEIYADKASTGTLKFFRDITSGSNGTCRYYCDARARYDYVTGLGTPQTDLF
jgi:subtilase family serine protease